MLKTIQYAWGFHRLRRHQRRRLTDPRLRNELTELETRGLFELSEFIDRLIVMSHSLRMDDHPGGTFRADLDEVMKKAADHLEAAAGYLEEIYDDAIAFNARKER